MPHYFIDTHDGAHVMRDEDGITLPGLRVACDEAIRVLPGIARDVLSDGDPLPHGQRRDFVSIVRNERNQLLFRATLSLSTECLLPDPMAS